MEAFVLTWPLQMESLPVSGQVITKDFRNSSTKKYRENSPLKVVQWNIERAYKIDEIILLLSSINADIVCLQELDIGCARSNYVNSFNAIGQALKMNGAFVTEFEELYSTLRSRRTQVLFYFILRRVEAFMEMQYFPFLIWNRKPLITRIIHSTGKNLEIK